MLPTTSELPADFFSPSTSSSSAASASSSGTASASLGLASYSGSSSEEEEDDAKPGSSSLAAPPIPGTSGSVDGGLPAGRGRLLSVDIFPKF